MEILITFLLKQDGLRPVSIFQLLVKMALRIAKNEVNIILSKKRSNGRKVF
jgi:hypothetical protein